MIESKGKIGFKYLIEVIKDGKVVDSEVVENIIPTEGLNHMLNVVLNGTTPVTDWFIGLYENDYTPLATDAMATFPGAGVALETTAYTAAARLALTTAAAAAGAVTNTANKAEFTFNATKTIRGGFISSSSTKGGTTGTLLSAVKFATAKSMEADAILRVTAGLTLTST